MLIRIEKGSAVPISSQIAEQIAMLCASGKLAPGDRLPSVRELAREVAVNQNTILRVYERLVRDGLLEMRHGQGTFVAGGCRRPHPGGPSQTAHRRAASSSEAGRRAGARCRRSPRTSHRGTGASAATVKTRQGEISG